MRENIVHGVYQPPKVFISMSEQNDSCLLLSDSDVKEYMNPKSATSQQALFKQTIQTHSDALCEQ